MTGIFDTGATTSITGEIALLTNIRECYIVVMCANKAHMVCRRMGTMVLSHKGRMIVINDCLFVPGCMTLISARQITKMGFVILLHDEFLCVYRTIEDIRRSNPYLQTDKQINDKLWTIPIKSVSPYAADTPEQNTKSANSLATMVDDATAQWSAQTYHEACDHRNLNDLKLLWPHLHNIDSLPICDACMSQSVRQKYSKKGHRKNINNEESKRIIYHFIPGKKTQLPFNKSDEKHFFYKRN